MAKKDEKSVSTGTTQTPAAASTSGDTQTQTTPATDDRYVSLEETIRKQGETISQLEEFVAGVNPVVNTLVSDEALRKQFQESYARQTGVQTQQPQQTPAQTQGYTANQNQGADFGKQVTEVVTSQRDTIIRDFERSYGIDQLPPEEQKATKQKIATYLGDFGWEVDKMPLPALRSSLDKAYMGSVGIEKLREEGKLEGVVAMRTNQMGTFGSMSGGAPNTSDQTGELTSKQKEWLDKLRVKDKEGATKLYQDRENEQDREKEVK